MRYFSRGIWTCAALYVALGLIGIFFLTRNRALPRRARVTASPPLHRHRCAEDHATALGRAETALCQRCRLLKPSGIAIFDTRMKSTATSAVMSAMV